VIKHIFYIINIKASYSDILSIFYQLSITKFYQFN